MRDTGIKYEVTGEAYRDQVCGYHGSPEPKFLNKAKSVDLKGLKGGYFKNSTEGVDEVESLFTIGFEIEKLRVHRGAVTEYPLFKGFERDSSINSGSGVEAVTHVLPLLGKSLWRTKVFNMFVEAKKIISDEYSPSDSSCGGHITLGVRNMTGHELAQKVRKNMGIIYAIFRKRLPNSYCSNNLNIMPRETEQRFVLGGNHYKYCPVKIMDHAIELRLPSRVQSVKQMMRRYELCYELINFSVNNPNGTYNKFLKIVRPILLSMYEGDADKVDFLENLSKDFRRMILTGKFNKEVMPYVEGWRIRKHTWDDTYNVTRRRRLDYERTNNPNQFTRDLLRNYDAYLSEWQHKALSTNVHTLA